MHKAVFTIGEEPQAYIGYTSGKRWNGWATPHFELEEAKRVAEGFNKCAEYPMEYDEVYDQFYILDTETKELETWKGTDIPTAEGIKSSTELVHTLGYGTKQLTKIVNGLPRELRISYGNMTPMNTRINMLTERNWLR